MARVIHIIDDDASMLEALTASIKALGHKVVSYSSAKIFIEQGAPKQPQVILIDVQMPEMNGLELQSYLKSLKNPPTVILISGQSHPKQIIYGMKAGAVDFLIKPFSLEELDNSLKSAIEKSNAQDEKNHHDEKLKAIYSTLTPREQQVFVALGRGVLLKNIAVNFGVSVSVIKLHKSRVMKKMKLQNLQELAQIFDQLGRPIAPMTITKKST